MQDIKAIIYYTTLQGILYDMNAIIYYAKYIICNGGIMYLVRIHFIIFFISSTGLKA